MSTETIETTETKQNQKPVASFKVGAVRAAVWQSPEGHPSVTFERIYKSVEGDWKSAYTYDLGGLAELRLVIEKAEAKLKELY